MQNAKALFRATGNTSAPGEREQHDFYPTPTNATTAFLAVEGDVLRAYGDVWEAAAGDGAISDEMESFGLTVYKSDLIDRGCGAEIADFFTYKTAPCPAMVTNPPYCEINARDGGGRWLTHAFDIGCEYIALLLNWDWPAASGLSGILDEHPISRVYLCRWKIDFTGKGAPPQRNAWFVWDRSWHGNTALRFLDRIDWRQDNLDL